MQVRESINRGVISNSSIRNGATEIFDRWQARSIAALSLNVRPQAWPVTALARSEIGEPGSGNGERGREFGLRCHLRVAQAITNFVGEEITKEAIG